MAEKRDLNIGVMVSTRFGVGVKDVEWLEHRFLLFESITAASLRSQTYQDFIWNIFIGSDPFDWVTERLTQITKNIGRKVILIKSPQRAARLDENFDGEFGKKIKLLCLIDDDDAWRINYLEKVVSAGENIFSKNKNNIAITFSYGYEWVVSNLIDVDALVKKI